MSAAIASVAQGSAQRTNAHEEAHSDAVCRVPLELFGPSPRDQPSPVLEELSKAKRERFRQAGRGGLTKKEVRRQQIVRPLAVVDEGLRVVRRKEAERPSGDPADLVEAAERAEIIRRAIADLPEPWREVLEPDLAGKSTQEIAQGLGLTARAVQKRRSLANSALSKALGEL